MGLLKSVDNVPGVEYYEYREQNYYNKHKYRARFRIYGVRLVYHVKSTSEFLQRVNSGGYRYNPITEKQKQQILQNTAIFENIIKLRNKFLKENLGTVRIEGDMISFYCDDLNLLQTIRTWSTNHTCDITEAQMGNFAGVKYFVNDPKSKYRVYLRSKRVSDSTVAELRQFLETNKSLKPSSSLKRWLSNTDIRSWRMRYCSSAFSIDYDNESTLSLLAIVHGDLIGRRYKLEKREQVENPN